MAKKQQQLIRITQVKSRIGYKPKARATLDALGLRKINQFVEKVKNKNIHFYRGKGFSKSASTKAIIAMAAVQRFSSLRSILSNVSALV